MKKITVLAVFILLVLSLEIRSERIELEGLDKPSYITCDTGHIYIVDGSVVKIYSLKDYSKTGEFGKKGSGPGEFQAGRRGGAEITICPEGENLLIYNARRHLIFSKNGNYIEEKKISKRTSPLKPFNGGFLGTMFARADKGFVVKFVWMNNKYDNVKDLGVWERNRGRGFDVFGQGIKYAGVKDRIFWFDKDKKKMMVADKSGMSAGEIDLKIAPRELAASDKDAITEYYKLRFGAFFNRMKDRMVFPEVYPDVMEIASDGEYLYILTWNIKESKREVIVYNSKGNELKRGYFELQMESPMLIAPLFFKDGKVYQIVENEDTEEWELGITSIIN